MTQVEGVESRPETGPGDSVQNLCADKEYFGIPARDRIGTAGKRSQNTKLGDRSDLLNKKDCPFIV
jgi:hypothetical protein